MKKNDWILLISVILYSYLFYQQSAGINFLLFNIVLIIGSALKNPANLKAKSWLVAAGGALISSACVMYYSSPLAILANVISLGLVAYFSLSPNTSVILALMMQAMVVGSSCVYMFSDWARRSKNKSDQRSKPLYVILIMIAIITLIVILFFVMYQGANPVFKEFTKDINLDFISWPWIFFTLGGLLLLYGFYYNWRIEYFNNRDVKAPNDISTEDAHRSTFLNQTFRLETEYSTGFILFALLNVMLLLLNVLDLGYLWFDGQLPEEVDHKEFVHNGIGMLIMSILFAIIIILYFFRGRLNYHEKSKYLKWLACFWIFQNAFMIFSSVYRTNLYVEEFGISYKKIGVYVYLGLTLIGLITTFIKVTKLKSNWYLVRVNTWCYFVLLVISCIFNWDVIITNFNISKALTENKKLEKYYLADLSFKNLPQLLQLNDTIKANDDFGVRDYYYSSRGTYFFNFKTALDEKLYKFMKEMQNPCWQSWSAEKARIYDEVFTLSDAGQIKKMDLSKYGAAFSLSPLSKFNKLEELDVSQNSFDSISELSFFPGLKSLNISNNNLNSLNYFPALRQLKKLNVSGNPGLSSTKAIQNAPELEELDLSSCSIGTNSLPDLKKLKKLNLSANPISDFSGLEKYPELNELSIANTFNENFEIPFLQNLESIDVSSNKLDRYNSPEVFRKISACKNLRSLKADNNALETLTALVYKKGSETDSSKFNFPHIENLNVSNNQLYNLHDIVWLKDLKVLELANNKFTSIADLLALKQLTELDISGNTLKSLKGISELQTLEKLDIAFCSVAEDLSEVAKLNKLVLLRISSNNLKDIKMLLALQQLKQLYLQANQLTSIEGIEKLGNLEELNLRDNSIDDYSPLYKMKSLRILYVDPMPKQKLLKLKKSLPNCTVYDYDPDNFYRSF